MAIYNGSTFNRGAQAPVTGPAGYGGSLKVLDSGDVKVTTALANNDNGTLFVAPKGFTYLFSVIKSTDMDTNGSPTAVLNIGDAGASARFVAASNVMQAGTASVQTVGTGAGYTFTADTPVTWTVPTGPATGAIGEFRVWHVGYFTGTPA